MSSPVVCITCGATSYNDSGKILIRCNGCYIKLVLEIADIRIALTNLFQACAFLPLDEMNRMEKEINAASNALGRDK